MDRNFEIGRDPDEIAMSMKRRSFRELIEDFLSNLVSKGKGVSLEEEEAISQIINKGSLEP